MQLFTCCKSELSWEFWALHNEYVDHFSMEIFKSSLINIRIYEAIYKIIKLNLRKISNNVKEFIYLEEYVIHFKEISRTFFSELLVLMTEMKAEKMRTYLLL